MNTVYPILASLRDVPRAIVLIPWEDSQPLGARLLTKFTQTEPWSEERPFLLIVGLDRDLVRTAAYSHSEGAGAVGFERATVVTGDEVNCRTGDTLSYAFAILFEGKDWKTLAAKVAHA